MTHEYIYRFEELPKMKPKGAETSMHPYPKKFDHETHVGYAI